MKGFNVFFAIFGCGTDIMGNIVTKWLEIYQDNLQTRTAKAVARLMSFCSNYLFHTVI